MAGAAVPVQRVSALPPDDEHPSLDRHAWPANLPCVRQLLDEGLDLGRLTVLVGENGSGKSTLTEAIAMAFGMSPEGGSTGARHSSRVTESPLGSAIALRRGIGAAKWGFFLRAETMHGYYTYLEHNPSSSGSGDAAFHEMSHGESILEVLSSRVRSPGLYVLDEPESALSFSGCLALVGLLHRIATSEDQQAVVATHSPMIAATPGATLIEVGDHGLVHRSWGELELVQNWRDFLAEPGRFLRHVLD